MRKASIPYPSTPGWTVLVLFVIGVAVSTFIPGNIYRGWFALAAFVLSLAFVVEYSRRNWRSTFAGRASMLFMGTTVIYTANLVLFLWWPSSERGYPHWEDVTEVLYLMIALAALYKLMVLIHAGRRPEAEHDPTVKNRD